MKAFCALIFGLPVFAPSQGVGETADSLEPPAR